MQTTISILIPAYNAEKTIKRTLDSILNQTLLPFEIVIVNDGSTDKTQDILNEYENYKLFKKFNKTEGEYFSSKLYTINELINNKDKIEIEELV